MKQRSIYPGMKKGAKKASNANWKTHFKQADSKFLIFYTGLALVASIALWLGGVKSIFVFPTILCIGLVVRHRRQPSPYFSRGSRALPIKRSK